jgi:ferritin
MQIGEEVRAAMNAQVGHELDASYRYLAMSAWCTENRLPGCASWLRNQAGEELEHAMKFFDFIHSRGGTVLLPAIATPPDEFTDVRAIFTAALAHERKVSAQIHDIYALAGKQSDFASQQFLQWFLAEQVEEEENVGGVVDRLVLAGDSGQALLLIDQELGDRDDED